MTIFTGSGGPSSGPGSGGPGGGPGGPSTENLDNIKTSPSTGGGPGTPREESGSMGEFNMGGYGNNGGNVS